MNLFDRYCAKILLEISQQKVNSTLLRQQDIKSSNPVARKREQSFFVKSQEYARKNNSLVRFSLTPVDSRPQRSFEFFISGKVITDNAAKIFTGVSYTADEQSKTGNGVLIVKRDYSVFYVPDITALSTDSYNQGDLRRSLDSNLPTIPFDKIAPKMLPAVLRSSVDAQNLRLSVIKYFRDDGWRQSTQVGPGNNRSVHQDIGKFSWKSLPFLDSQETKVNKFGQTVDI